MSKPHDHDGSLVIASLRFAAALLPADATPAQICTKPALSAIVVASHRLAQQASPQLQISQGSTTTSTDPRRLLIKLLALGLDEQLTRVAFADITWDSEGVVAQTLEMELQDVEERASATLHQSVCVLIAVGDSTRSETAVVWFPRRRLDDNNNNNNNCENTSKSHKYLLFVAPGRVKVVKSLSELMKKMHEEMAVLRDGTQAAVLYRAWTLVDGSSNAKRKKDATKQTSDAQVQNDVPTNSQPTSKPSVVPTRQDEVPEQEYALMKKPAETKRQQGECEPQRVRVRVVKEDPVERESMFAFPRVAPVESMASSEQERRREIRSSESDEKELSSVPMTVASPATNATSTPGISNEPATQQRTQHARVGVSASHIGGIVTKTEKIEPAESSLWQSVDGAIKRSRRVSPKSISLTRDDPDSEINSTETSVCYKRNEIATNEANIENESVRDRRIRPHVSQKSPRETMFQFLSTQVVAAPDIQPPNPSSPRETEESDRQQEQAEVSISEVSNQESDLSISEGLEESAVEVEAPVQNKKKRSARDHYRSKLGARVWWELEYQATKILHQDFPAQDHCDTGRDVRGFDGRRREIVINPSREAVAIGKTTQWTTKRDAVAPPNGNVESVAPSTWIQESQCEPKSKKPPLEAPQQPHPRAQSESEFLEPAPVRHAWETPETAAVAVKSPEVPRAVTVKVQEERDGRPAIPLQSTLPVRSSSVGSDRQPVAVNASKSVAPVPEKIAKAAQPVAAERNTATAAASSGVQATKRSWVDEPHDEFYPQTQAKVNAARTTTVVCSLLVKRTNELESQANPEERDLAKPTEAPSPVCFDRRIVSSSTQQAKSGRFQTRQSRDHEGWSDDHDDGDDDLDSVLMATMVPRIVRQSITDKPETVLPVAYREQDVEHADHDEIPESTLPFNVRGRVSIRKREPVAEVIKRASHQRGFDGQQAQEDPESVDAPLSPEPMAVAVPVDVDPHPRGHRGPPPVATFISVAPSHSANAIAQRDDDATQRTRQQKLTELRQKKLQQLQRARDNALNKRKPSAHQHPSVPLVVHLDAKAVVLATGAAAPPTTMRGDRTAPEAFPLGATTTRTGHRPSNRQLIQNAIEYTLLAGFSLDKERQAALQALNESSCDNFIVLLKSAKELKFRALYEHHMDRGRIVKLFGITSSAPPVLSEDVISQFFRYNSGKKAFTAIDGRSFTVKTDACALVDQLVFKNRKKALHRLL